MLWRLIVTVEVSLGWSDTSKMSHSLSMLASDKSKTTILDCIADLSCASTSIIGQDKPSSDSSSYTMYSRASFQSPTLWDADVRCIPTTMINLHMLWLCHKSVSPSLVFWYKNSIPCRLVGLCELDWQLYCDSYNDMCPGRFSAPEL
jgi:hypothetical protein